MWPFNRKSKRVVFFGGTFNPVTHSHIAIIRMLSKKYSKVIVAPTFCTLPYKQEGTDFLIPFEERVEMLELAVLESGVSEKVIVSSIEKNIAEKSNGYTINILRELSSALEMKIDLAIGSDQLGKLGTWREWDTIVRDYPIVVISRDSDKKLDYYPWVPGVRPPLFLKKPKEGPSSSMVRSALLSFGKGDGTGSNWKLVTSAISGGTLYYIHKRGYFGLNPKTSIGN